MDTGVSSLISTKSLLSVRDFVSFQPFADGLELLLQFMTPNEFTQWFNLARALDLVVSSRSVNGVIYVYTDNGYAKPWHVFATEYPLERLQAMVDRARQRSLKTDPSSLSTPI